MRDIARRLVVYQVALQSFQVRKLYARMPYGIPAGCTRSLPASYPHPTCTHLYSTCTPPVLSRHPLYRPLYVLYPVPCCTSCRAVMYTGYRGRAVRCRTATATAPAQQCQCSGAEQQRSSGNSNSSQPPNHPPALPARALPPPPPQALHSPAVFTATHGRN